MINQDVHLHKQGRRESLSASALYTRKPPDLEHPSYHKHYKSKREDSERTNVFLASSVSDPRCRPHEVGQVSDRRAVQTETRDEKEQRHTRKILKMK